jgi:hypothetical protein
VRQIEGKGTNAETRKSCVDRAKAEAEVKVSYDGDPQFKPIESTDLSYASNTQDKIIKVGDLYYLCFQGVWFMSTSPEGPWKTADSVPKEIYTYSAKLSRL